MIPSSENYFSEQKISEFVDRKFFRCVGKFLSWLRLGETYWFEYIGNDQYVVRSDNNLGKKFEMTQHELLTNFFPVNCETDKLYAMKYCHRLGELGIHNGYIDDIYNAYRKFQSEKPKSKEPNIAQLIKTKGWIFVDDNQLHITVIDKPYWVESEKYWRAKNGTELLPRELFPDMKQEDTPIEVEITVNSIPTEQPSEDLEEAAKEYSGKSSHPLNNAFKDGAKWQKEQDEKIIEERENICVKLWDILDDIDTYSDLQINDTNSDNPFRIIENKTQQRHKLIQTDGYDLFLNNKKLIIKEDEQ